MADLIERLEKATGPDRELDAQIALLIGVVPEGAFRPCAAPDIGTFATGAYSLWTCERYTASVDAALTLVPEGWFLHDVGECVMPVSFVGDKHSPTGWFQAGLQWRDGGGRMQRANGHSLALALCIAALRARTP